MRTAQLVFLLTLLLFIGCPTKGNPIDSIRNELQKGKNIPQLLSYISTQTKTSDTTNQAFADLGLQYAIDHKLSDWQVVFHLNQAQIAFHATSDQNASISHAFQALQIIKEQNVSHEHEGWAHSLLARGLEQIGSYQEAINHRKAQLDWVLKNHNDNRVFVIYSFIGTLFIQLNENDSAICYYKKALTHKDIKGESIKNSASYINNIGLAYFYKEQLDSAKIYFEQALYLLKERNSENEKSCIRSP